MPRVYTNAGGVSYRVGRPPWIKSGAPNAGGWVRARQGWLKWGGWIKLWQDPYDNALLFNVNYGVDRRLYVNYNLRTGALSVTTDGDGRTSVRAFTTYLPPLPEIGDYTNVVVTQGFNNNTNGSNGGSWRPQITITAQPSAANDWTVSIFFNDDPWGNAAYGDVNFHLTAS